MTVDEQMFLVIKKDICTANPAKYVKLDVIMQ